MTPQRLEIHRKRLKNAIVLFTVTPAFLVAVCVLVYALKSVDIEHSRAAETQLAVVAEAGRARVEHSMDSAGAFLEMLVQRSGEMSAGELQHAFLSLKRSMVWIDGLDVMDPSSGGRLAVGQPLPQQLPPALRNKEGLLVTEVQAAPDGTPRFFIAIGEGPDLASATARLSVNAHLFSALLDRERLGRTGETFLVNGAGALQTKSVLHGGILDRVEGTLVTNDVSITKIARREWSGTTLLYVALPLNNLPGWLLVAQRDSREIFEPLHSTMTRFAALAVICLLLLGAASLRAAKKFMKLQEEMDTDAGRLRECELQVQKLDAISQLGVGIAHEVNNPLAIIGEEAGWMQDLLRRDSFKDHPDAGELRESLRQIVTQTARSREITHKLLSFGGKTDGTIRDVEMNTLVADVAALRRREASQRSIEIREELAPRLPVVLSEPALLRQLLINLINNAMDAMPEGGPITISTAPSEGGGVRLQVRDTGFGIPRENLDKIFDPFFTTKPPGKGAGLGLSISHGILQRIGGRISVDSTAGQGTTITIELPLEARPLIS